MKHDLPSFIEDHISQVPALQLLQQLGYTYLTEDEAVELRGGRLTAPCSSMASWSSNCGRSTRFASKGKSMNSQREISSRQFKRHEGHSL